MHVTPECLNAMRALEVQMQMVHMLQCLPTLAYSALTTGKILGPSSSRHFHAKQEQLAAMRCSPDFQFSTARNLLHLSNLCKFE